MLKLKKEKEKSEREKQLEKLKNELKECNFMLKCSEDNFHFATDEHLIEARIYEMKSLSKHRDYIIASIRNTISSEKQPAGLQEQL